MKTKIDNEEAFNLGVHAYETYRSLFPGSRFWSELDINERTAWIKVGYTLTEEAQATLTPPAPVLGDRAEDQVIQWPKSEPVCRCVVFGGAEGEFTCPKCGGLRF